jgi:hypothetical protein
MPSYFFDSLVELVQHALAIAFLEFCPASAASTQGARLAAHRLKIQSEWAKLTHPAMRFPSWKNSPHYPSSSSARRAEIGLLPGGVRWVGDMHLVEHAKRFFAALILICFFLPLAQCSSKQPAGAEVRLKKPSTHVLVPAHEVNFKSLGEIPFVAMCVWPLAFIYVRSKTRSRGFMVLLSLAEAVIGGLVLWYLVQIISLWGAVRYGGIILVVSHVAYLGAVAITLYICLRGPFLKNQPPSS